jgi:hypothetical protein
MKIRRPQRRNSGRLPDAATRHCAAMAALVADLNLFAISNCMMPVRNQQRSCWSRFSSPAMLKSSVAGKPGIKIPHHVRIGFECLTHNVARGKTSIASANLNRCGGAQLARPENCGWPKALFDRDKPCRPQSGRISLSFGGCFEDASRQSYPCLGRPPLLWKRAFGVGENLFQQDDCLGIVRCTVGHCASVQKGRRRSTGAPVGPESRG